MSVIRYLFEGVASGTNATTGNVASTPAGFTASAVSPGAGGIIQFSNAHPHSGVGMRFQGGGTAGPVLRLPFAAANVRAKLTGYSYATSLPPVDLDFNFRHAAGVNFRVRLHTNGSVSLRDSGGGTLLGTATAAGAWAANRQNRIAIVATVDTGTPANGSAVLHVYNADGSTPTGTATASAHNIGAAAFTHVDLGTPSNGTNTWEHFWDDVQMEDGGTTTELDVYTPTLTAITGVTATRASATTAQISWNTVGDAPDGYSIARAPGLKAGSNDGLGVAPGAVGYDPLTISGAAIVADGVTSSPYTDSGLTSGSYTWWVTRTDA